MVLGLLAWIFLAALGVVLSVEINVVRTKQLLPRAPHAPFTDNVDLTRADQRAYADAATSQRRYERWVIRHGPTSQVSVPMVSTLTRGVGQQPTSSRLVRKLLAVTSRADGLTSAARARSEVTTSSRRPSSSATSSRMRSSAAFGPRRVA